MSAWLRARLCASVGAVGEDAGGPDDTTYEPRVGCSMGLPRMGSKISRGRQA